jgi:hypothetical protein
VLHREIVVSHLLKKIKEWKREIRELIFLPDLPMRATTQIDESQKERIIYFQFGLSMVKLELLQNLGGLSVEEHIIQAALEYDHQTDMQLQPDTYPQTFQVVGVNFPSDAWQRLFRPEIGPPDSIKDAINLYLSIHIP